LQPNHTPAPQVDRRQDLECACFCHATMLPY
jgi:hypothetical protein